jgi:hypothetical protein
MFNSKRVTVIAKLVRIELKIDGDNFISETTFLIQITVGLSMQTNLKILLCCLSCQNKKQTH